MKLTKIVARIALVAVLAVTGCGGDDSSEKKGALPPGDFSVCVFAYGDAGDQEQLLIGPCAIPPLEALDQGLNVAYVEQDGATGTMLARAFRNGSVSRRLVTDADQAAALRSRIRELTAACARDVNGCLSR